MWPSWLRALRAAPPATLDELRPHADGEALWLRCTHPKCTHCQDLQSEGRLAAFEADKAHVVAWDCSRERQRELAKRAGVRDLPAYIRVPHRGDAEVVTL